MMARYEKPTIEFEEYGLNAAIAAGCETIINIYPYNPDTGEAACSDYGFVESIQGQDQITANTDNFFTGSCSCYLSSGGTVLVTS